MWSSTAILIVMEALVIMIAAGAYLLEFILEEVMYALGGLLRA